jgi:hypothetical protein
MHPDHAAWLDVYTQSTAPHAAVLTTRRAGRRGCDAACGAKGRLAWAEGRPARLRHCVWGGGPAGASGGPAGEAAAAAAATATCRCHCRCVWGSNAPRRKSVPPVGLTNTKRNLLQVTPTVLLQHVGGTYP